METSCFFGDIAIPHFSTFLWSHLIHCLENKLISGHGCSLQICPTVRSIVITRRGGRGARNRGGGLIIPGRGFAPLHHQRSLAGLSTFQTQATGPARSPRWAPTRANRLLRPRLPARYPGNLMSGGLCQALADQENHQIRAAEWVPSSALLPCTGLRVVAEVAAAEPLWWGGGAAAVAAR